MPVGFLVLLAAPQVPTSDAWHAAVQEQHAPLQFPHALDFLHDSGFVPVNMGGHKAGFYFFKEDYSRVVEQYPALSKVNLQRTVAFSLEFGHGFECASAAYSAAVLVARFHAVAFDPQGASFMSQRQLEDAAKICEQLGN